MQWFSMLIEHLSIKSWLILKYFVELQLTIWSVKLGRSLNGIKYLDCFFEKLVFQDNLLL